jgi:glycosyltransferase involved in cell wall biosynthesis
VKPGDLPSLANAMVRILSEPNEAKQMGEESLKLSNYYDIERVQEIHEQYYEKLIRQQAGRKQYPTTSWKRLKTWIGISE